MTKVTKLVLMLCLTLSGALCHASGVAEQENEKGNDGIPIELINNSGHGSSEKSNSIIAMVNGNMLLVTFTENLGQVAVEVTTASGVLVDYNLVLTPNGMQVYLPGAGDYIITFYLPNGDEYYGEFTVTDD